MEISSLPIISHSKEIEIKFSENQIMIISGLPGCGKSTQLPKMLFNLTQHKTIITQPRRLAAIEMSKRVSSELKSSVKVDYTVRFEDTSTADTQIRFVTDGVLLRLLMDDRLFETYKIIIIDEVHERTLFIDLILFLMKRRLRNSPDVKLVLMSATMNIRNFANYFSEYKVATVLVESSRKYLLDIHHVDSHTKGHSSISDAIECVVQLHLNEPMGDILVFLPGAEECLAGIHGTQQRLTELLEEGKQMGSLQLHALFGAQTVPEQELVFLPVTDSETTRKVIFATNIAETSLTIDNVAFVIDSGLVKRTHFNKDSATVQLKTCLISKSQAIQRAGRAGRTRHGRAIRLYSKQVYNDIMTDQCEADIRRSELRSFIVMVMGLGVTDFVSTDFIDEPDPVAVKTAIEQLFVAGIVRFAPQPVIHKETQSVFGKTTIFESVEAVFTNTDLRESIRQKITSEFRKNEQKVADDNPQSVSSSIAKKSFILSFVLTEIGKATLRFPVDPLFSKLLLFSKLAEIENDVLKLVAISASTENLMSNTFEAKKIFYKAKIKEADRSGDFYTFVSLVRNHKGIFHAKALRNLMLIEKQLQGILANFKIENLRRIFRDDFAYLNLQRQTLKLTSVDKIELGLLGCFSNNLGRKLPAKNEYRLGNSGMIALMDSESVFEIINYFPEFVVATVLRGEGHLGVPTLGNVFRVKNPSVAFEYIAKLKELEDFGKTDIRTIVDFEETSLLQSNKVEQAKLKYLERKKIKIN